MDDQPTLYGSPYSVYVRAVRLALAEKEVPYRLVPVDVFAETGPPPEHMRRHPFGRIPAFEHCGFQLYEAGAITRYVDEAFEGPSLHPGSPQDRARTNQIISILDAYAYRTLVWDIYVERISVPKRNQTSNEAKIAAALPRADVCLAALERIMADGPFLTGPRLTLADLHAVPMLAYFKVTREGEALLARHRPMQAWWDVMASRASVVTTEFS